MKQLLKQLIKDRNAKRAEIALRALDSGYEPTPEEREKLSQLKGEITILETVMDFDDLPLIPRTRSASSLGLINTDEMLNEKKKGMEDDGWPWYVSGEETLPF